MGKIEDQSDTDFPACQVGFGVSEAAKTVPHPTCVLIVPARYEGGDLANRVKHLSPCLVDIGGYGRKEPEMADDSEDGYQD